MNRQNIESFLTNHVTYPTTADAINKALVADHGKPITTEDKTFVKTNLPAGDYATVEAVIQALGW